MAGGATAVPAEVVELVAYVRHRQLVHDPSFACVDDRQEVRRLDARAFMQAGEIEELLRRPLERLLGRGVERWGAVRMHSDLLLHLTKSYD